jgi:hypothetical protein
MESRGLRALAAAMLLFCGPVRANAVAEWNFIATQVAMSEEQPSVQPGHALTMVHVAMFEVLNFIDPRYASPYLVHPPGPVNVSRPAAVAAAAHFMLVEFYPDKKPQLDEALRNSLARIPARTDNHGGEIQGRALAMNLYALRSLVLGEEIEPLSGPAYSALSWNPLVAELAAARGLGLIETARVHALVSITVLRTYEAQSRNLCAACVADTAVRTVFDAEFGSAQAGKEIGKSALTYWMPLERREKPLR